MRKSDFIAFVTTDYQDRIASALEQLNELYRITGGKYSITVGWGNGYVLVPKQCSLYEKSYISIESNIHIPYDFSFSGMLANDVKIEIIKGTGKGKNYLTEPYWCFGFDTYGCKATKEEVVKATLELRMQLIDICSNKGDKIRKY